MQFTQPLYAQNQSPDVLDQGEKAAKALLESYGYAAARTWQPSNGEVRPQVEVMAHKNLGWIAMQRKNWAGAEAEFQKALALTPNDATVDYLMGTCICFGKEGGPRYRWRCSTSLAPLPAGPGGCFPPPADSRR